METTTAAVRRNTRSAAWYAQAIDAAQTQAENYLQMLALATKLGMEYEMERMQAGADEMLAEADSLIERACDQGYVPEELWG